MMSKHSLEPIHHQRHLCQAGAAAQPSPSAQGHCLGPLCYFQLFIAPSATCWFIGIFWIFPHSVLISHLQHSTAVCFNCLTAVQLFPWALFLPTSHPTPAERTQEHQKLEYSRTAFPSLMILFCHLQKVCLTFSLWFWRWQFLKKTKGNAPAEKSVLIYVM